MERKFTKKLFDWKHNRINFPLMVIGARQTGKTYILKQFCAENFDKTIYVNFEEDKDYISFFKDSLNPFDIVKKIEAYRGEKIDIEKSVFLFDEIQVSERVITSLKYFCESELAYKVICAGSLLGVKINRFSSSFPVGKVWIEHLYPMDFEEFLLAIGERLLAEEIQNCFRSIKPMNEALHNKALLLYRTYLCVGGMPQSVLEYVDKKGDLVSYSRNIHNNIILAYLADMTKYTTGTEAVKVNSVYDSMPSQLTKENKKFSYKLVSSKAKKESYESSIDWLLSSGLLLKSTKIELPQAPLSAYRKPNIFKLFLSDVGLLTSLCKLSFGDILLERSMIYRGVLTENFIAQTFISNGYELMYWESKSQAEVDFILSLDDGIVPVEVKSGDNTKSQSLSSYIKRYNPQKAFRISTKNFGQAVHIVSVPLYAAHMI